MTPPPLTRTEFIAATVLALDHGLRRIGVALKPAGQDWALPCRILEAETPAQAVRAARALIAEYQPQAIVVGLPLNADPTQAHAVRRFTRKTSEGLSGIRWLFVDERYSSQTAERLAQEANALTARRATRQAPQDDLAAKLILDAYLATLKAEPVKAAADSKED